METSDKKIPSEQFIFDNSIWSETESMSKNSPDNTAKGSHDNGNRRYSPLNTATLNNLNPGRTAQGTALRTHARRSASGGKKLSSLPAKRKKVKLSKDEKIRIALIIVCLVLVVAACFLYMVFEAFGGKLYF